MTVVVCDNSGFNDGTRACTGEELCQETVVGKSAHAQQDSGISVDIYGIHFVNEDVGYVSARNSTVRKTTNRGVTWEYASPSSGATILYDIYTGGTLPLYAGNIRACLFRCRKHMELVQWSTAVEYETGARCGYQARNAGYRKPWI